MKLWIRNFHMSGRFKYLYFQFDFANGQSIKISQKYQNIGWIDADFNERGVIFQHFSSSTRESSCVPQIFRQHHVALPRLTGWILVQTSLRTLPS